ncbi:hypothetical protein J6590_025636 [Homalodisca vitripennis]|nr:hypothetical protein J6590_025636 [Homalodisca vitripennis]
MDTLYHRMDIDELWFLQDGADYLAVLETVVKFRGRVISGITTINGHQDRVNRPKSDLSLELLSPKSHKRRKSFVKILNVVD